MKKNNQLTYGAFELKKIYSRNYLIGIITAILVHLIIFFVYYISIPADQSEKSEERYQIVTYVELGPPPSIIPDSPRPAVSTVKPTFGNLKIAKKGEATEEFEVPKVTAPQGDVKVEPPKPAEKKVEPIDETYYVGVDVMPEPFGGIEALQKNVNYPEQARREEIVGKVFVKAFIDENGEVDRAEIVKGIGYGCDEEALWIVKNTRFRAGKKNGKNVRVQLTIPVSFKP